MKRSIKNIIMFILIIIVCVLIGLTINYSKQSIKQNNNSNMPQMNNQPPSMPEGDNSSQTPPEKPDDDKANDNSTEEIVKDDMNTPPKVDNNMNKNENSNSSLKVYYILLSIESLVASCLITYLIMSNFNKKNIKGTFYNSDKMIIGGLTVAIITILLVFLTTKLSTNLSSSKEPSFNNNSTNINYSSTKELTDSENISSGTYTSTNKDENVISASNVTSTISNASVIKSGDSKGGDNTSFYGTNSAIIAKDGANLTLKNINVTTNATGANGVFCYGGSATTNNSSNDGTTLTISDSVINTTKDNSGGIMTTGGGILNATNLTISTEGVSSAAIRTDRGGGTVNVNKGTYTTKGKGSPAIYSTASINVSNAKLVSTASEGIVIEGKNSVTIDNVDLIDTNNKLNGQSTTYKNIFLYQSMSGDAATGTAKFTSKNSRITTNKGDTFYVTNTNATIELNNNEIINNDSNGNFLRIQKDSWGNKGSNGGIVNFIMSNQKASGSIVVDSISTLDLYVKNSSYFEGSINNENTAKSVKLILDNSSSIKLTADSYVTSFENTDKTNNNINFNGYKLYVNGKAINE